MAAKGIIPVIMCGGSGSRLWPLSRAQLPKPFVELPSGGTLLQETFAGLAALAPQRVIAVCAAEHLANVRAIFRLAGLAADLDAIAEPRARNTGPAAAVAARFVRERFGADATLALLPADHSIKKRPEFCRALQTAAVAARQNRLAVLGIRPDRHSDQYGYIKAGKESGEGWCAVDSFIEKPDLQRARQMIEAGGHYWNAGVFVARAGVLESEFAKQAPEIARTVGELELPATGDWFPDAENYARFAEVSIDYAVAEKSENIALVPDVDAGWSDVGDWHSFAQLIPATADGNRARGRAQFNSCADCAVFSTTDRLVALIGLEKAVVADTADALLVLGEQVSGEAGNIYRQLAAAGDLCALSPPCEQRPWGRYTVLASGPGFKLKRVDVDPGARLSLQSHASRSEHWIVVAGTMTVTVGERVFDLAVEESCHVPRGTRHRMANRTDRPAAVIELQLGDYLGEDDIKRYEDDYQRF